MAAFTPFTVHTGTAAPLRRSDGDTRQLTPSDWLKRVERTGFGVGLFSAWRQDPEFVLNDNRYDGATILLAGPDFGTGSSREHAVGALSDYGFRAVISARFADIFRGNSLKNGLLPVQLPAADVETLQAAVERDPQAAITIDLDARQVRCERADLTVSFEIDDFTRWRLMEGL